MIKAIEQVKTFSVGFVIGLVATSPLAFAHHQFYPGEIMTNGDSQWQFDTLAGALAATAFAPVYRYFVKDEEDEGLVSFSILKIYMY